MKEPRGSKNWRFRWIVVFSMNLIVPLLFGWMWTSQEGRIGMFIAIILLWFWPNHVGENHRGFAFAMLAGGVIVGVSQLMPFLHIFAGMVGMSVASPFGATIDGRDPTVGNELGGFVVTAITGSLLQVAALFLGGIAYLLFGWFSGQSSDEVKMCPQRGMFDPEIDARP